MKISICLQVTNIFLPIMLVMALLCSPAKGQERQTNKYLGQTAPGVTPIVFAPGLISKADAYEFGSVFSADGTEFFYGVDVGGRAEIRYTQLREGEWSMPAVLLQHETYGFNDPFLSPDENRLYFISDMPLKGEGPPKDIDIWYIERQVDDWTAPVNIGPPINTAFQEYYISFTSDGTLYYASNVNADEGRSFDFDLYAAVPAGISYETPIPLSRAVNSLAYEADAFVAYDESYIIFSSFRREGLGEGDLYISFRNDEKQWSLAQNMGPSINSQGHELCPFVTRDGAYFFYTSNKDLYWVDAEAVIVPLRKTASFQTN